MGPNERHEMRTLVLYGASDDLIEIAGDFEEEIGWYSRDEERAYLAVCDGSLFSVQYDKDGIWRFNLVRSGAASVAKVDGIVDDDERYTDRVTLTWDKPFTWVLLGETLVDAPRARKG